ncbi:MAG: hypothetical protein ACRCSG_05020 [Cellulosilyticaceae bacterium]
MESEDKEEIRRKKVLLQVLSIKVNESAYSLNKRSIEIKKEALKKSINKEKNS